MNGNVVLMEKFNNPELDKDLKWFSPPDKWEVNSESSKLIIKTNKQTDFWQKTHYGVPPTFRKFCTLTEQKKVVFL